MGKSYARELSVVVLLVSLGFLLYAVYAQDTMALDVGKFLAVPAIALVAAAFGLDKYNKQSK